MGGFGLGGIVLIGSLSFLTLKKYQIKKIESQIYSYRNRLIEAEKKHEGSVLNKYENILSQKKVSDYSLIEADVNGYIEFLKSTSKPQAVHWLAALELSYFLTEYSKSKEGLDLLDHVQSKGSSKKSSESWIYQLLLLKLGSLFMEEKNFTRALHIFSLILESKKNLSFHSEALVKTALCYEALGEVPKAQEIYALIQKNEANSLYKEKVIHYDRLNKIKTQLKSK